MQKKKLLFNKYKSQNIEISVKSVCDVWHVSARSDD